MSVDESRQQAVKLALADQRRRTPLDQGDVYILTNDRLNALCTGCTNGLRKRLLHHKRRLLPGFT